MIWNIPWSVTLNMISYTLTWFVCHTLVCFHVLSTETSGFMIRNKLLGKCLQVQDGHSGGGRVSLGECSPHLSIQEWRWLPESHALSSLHTGECLTAPAEQYEGVRLQPCILRADSDETGPGEGEMGTDREAGSQAWSCSKKGHLTLFGKGLHLSARQESTLVFLSKEHKQVRILKWEKYLLNEREHPIVHLI